MVAYPQYAVTYGAVVWEAVLMIRSFSKLSSYTVSRRRQHQQTIRQSDMLLTNRQVRLLAAFEPVLGTSIHLLEF